MDRLLGYLSDAVGAAPSTALTASFMWGVLSVVLSPCHLSSIPLVVAFIGGQKKILPRRAFGLSSTFAAGILVTIGIVGVVTGLLGRMLGDVGPYGRFAVAAVFLIVGLHLLGLIPMPFSGRTVTGSRGRGYAAALSLGLLFGLAVGPCTFAFMAPVMGVAFSVAATRLGYAVALLLAYGVGHCLVIALAGGSAGLVQRYLNWNESSRAVGVLRGVCGVLVLAAGAYMLWTALR